MQTLITLDLVALIFSREGDSSSVLKRISRLQAEGDLQKLGLYALVIFLNQRLCSVSVTS